MTEQSKRKKIATREERRVAADVGGKRVFMSGAGPDKGDVKSDLLRIEVKTTASESFAFNSHDWSDIVHSADNTGKTPVFVIKMSVKTYPFSVAILGRRFFLELAPPGTGAIPLNVEGSKSVTINRLWGQNASFDANRRAFRQVQMEVLHCASNEMARKKGDLVLIDYTYFVSQLRGL